MIHDILIIADKYDMTVEELQDRINYKLIDDDKLTVLSPMHVLGLGPFGLFNTYTFTKIYIDAAIDFEKGFIGEQLCAARAVQMKAARLNTDKYHVMPEIKTFVTKLPDERYKVKHVSELPAYGKIKSGIAYAVASAEKHMVEEYFMWDDEHGWIRKSDFTRHPDTSSATQIISYMEFIQFVMSQYMSDAEVCIKFLTSKRQILNNIVKRDITISDNKIIIQL